MNVKIKASVVRHGRLITCDGAQLARLRHAVRLSLAQVGAVVEQSRQTVHAWETCRSVPSDLAIHLLSELYGREAVASAVRITQINPT